jgi:hypothetical protein
MGPPASRFGDVDRVVPAGVAQGGEGSTQRGETRSLIGAIPRSSSLMLAFLIADLTRRLTLAGVCRVPWLPTKTGSPGWVCLLVAAPSRISLGLRLFASGMG